MKLAIKGKPKEIAALVSELQGRQGQSKPKTIDIKPPSCNSNDLAVNFKEAIEALKKLKV